MLVVFEDNNTKNVSKEDITFIPCTGLSRPLVDGKPFETITLSYEEFSEMYYRMLFYPTPYNYIYRRTEVLDDSSLPYIEIQEEE